MYTEFLGPTVFILWGFRGQNSPKPQKRQGSDNDPAQTASWCDPQLHDIDIVPWCAVFSCMNRDKKPLQKPYARSFHTSLETLKSQRSERYEKLELYLDPAV